jgi:tRNA(adenine34) deaminase
MIDFGPIFHSLILLAVLCLAVDAHLRVAVGAGVDQGQAGNAGNLGFAGFFQNHNGVGVEPASLHQAVKRFFSKVAIVGRIAEGQIKGALRCTWAKVRGIASPDFALANGTHSISILADDAARLSTFLNKLAELGAARNGFETQGPRAGEKVHDAGTFQFKIGDAVGQNIEQGFADTVGCGASGIGCRADKISAPEFSADNAHVMALDNALFSGSSAMMPSALPDPLKLPDAMRLAIAEAHAAAARGEVPVGAALVASDGEVLAVAGNRTLELKDPTAHAEMLVIREAARRIGSERLSGCDLHVTLEPCAMCAAAISFARVRRVYFGAGDEKMGAVEHGVRFFTQNTCHHRPEVYGGIGEAQSAEILRAFFLAKRVKAK